MTPGNFRNDTRDRSPDTEEELDRIGKNQSWGLEGGMEVTRFWGVVICENTVNNRNDSKIVLQSSVKVCILKRYLHWLPKIIRIISIKCYSS